MIKLAIIIHVLSATIWTGGHLLLTIVILPKILKTKDIKGLLNFEMSFEKIGMPALFLQIITGFYLSYNYLPNVLEWFCFSSHISMHISIKLILLLTTFALALNAKFRLIPNLSKGNKLNIFALHIILVTILSIIFVITGLSFRLDIF